MCTLTELETLTNLQNQKSIRMKEPCDPRKKRRRDKKPRMKFENEEKKYKRKKTRKKRITSRALTPKKNIEHSAVHATDERVVFLVFMIQRKIEQKYSTDYTNYLHRANSSDIRFVSYKRVPGPRFRNAIKQRENKRIKHFFFRTWTCLLVGFELRMPFVFGCVDRGKECLFFCFLFSFAFVGRFVVVFFVFFVFSFLYFVCLAVIILKFLSSGLTYCPFILTYTLWLNIIQILTIMGRAALIHITHTHDMSIVLKKEFKKKINRTYTWFKSLALLFSWLTPTTFYYTTF